MHAAEYKETRWRVSAGLHQEILGGKGHFEVPYWQPFILMKLVEAREGQSKGDVEKQEKICKQVFSQFLAYLYLENANKKDKVWVSSYWIKYLAVPPLGSNQYSKSITESNNVLSNHKFDVPKVSVKKNQFENRGKDQKGKVKEDKQRHQLIICTA